MKLIIVLQKKRGVVYLMMGNSRKFLFHKKQRYEVLWIGSLIYLFNLLGFTVTRVS